MKFIKKLTFLLVLLCTLVTAFALNVKVNAATANYVEASFGEGQYLITTVYNGTKYYLPTDKATSSGPKAIAFTDVNEISDDHLWTVTASGENYYIQNSAGQYLYTNNSNSGVRVNTTQHSWKYDSAANSFQETTTKRFLGIYNATDWRCYTTVNQTNYKESSTNFVFYKVNSAAPKVTVSGDTYTDAGDIVTLQAQLENVSGTVAWSSSNTNVATVDQSGNVTAKAMGTTTITATVNGTEGTLDFTVYPTDGSELTIAEALQVCELTGQENAPFVYSTTGVVVSIDTAYNGDYDNITVTITDGTNSIKAYRMVGGSDLAEGDKIKVTGTLVNYGGNTPEFIAGCTYENVTDANADAIRESLNLVNAYMSMAYKYTVSQKEISGAASSATMAYPVCDTTTNMAEDTNNASAVGLDENVFEVSAAKGGTTNNVGLNKAGQIRLYANKSDGNGNELTIATKNGQLITSIVIEFGSSLGSYTVNGVTGTAEASSSATYDVNSESVTIKNTTTGTTATQNYILSITINLAAGETTYVDEYSEVDFRFRFGIDASVAEIANIDEFGIEVSTASKTKVYASAVVNYDENAKIYYVIISLGDVLNNLERVSEEFTVTAFVEYDGVKYYSELTKTYSVSSIVDEYVANGVSSVNGFNDLLASLGY